MKNKKEAKDKKSTFDHKDLFDSTLDELDEKVLENEGAKWFCDQEDSN